MNKVTLLLLLLFVFVSVVAEAQSTHTRKTHIPTHVLVAPAPPEIFTLVSQSAAYNGGQEAMNKYLSTNMHYPDQAREGRVEGKVIIRFVIDETGIVTDPSVIRGIGAGCDQEAIRVVKSMPPWHPAKIQGKGYKQIIILPVMFKIL